MKPILLDYPMPIRTEHLIIRPPMLGDGELINKGIVESHEHLKQFMPWANSVPSLEDSEAYVRLAIANWILKKNEEPYLPLFIFDKEDQSFVGATGYHHMDWGVPAFEIGYWIRKKYGQRGFMTEAVNALTRYAFIILKAKRVSIQCDTLNTRSKNIPERLGYQLEGTLKNNRINPNNNLLSDTLIYARYNLEKLPDLKVEWATL